MKPVFLAAGAAGLVAAIAGCGDNLHYCFEGKTYDPMSKSCVPVDTCGTGTTLDPSTNECVPDGSVVCTNGTKFDPTTGTCAIDPNACQDGTVLVDGQCVDPNGGLTVDLQEGPEPNGFGVIEASPTPAGTISIKPVGEAFVIHGQIAPFQDANQDGQMDPDVDSYELAITGPTLLDVTAAGVHGIDGGFLSIAEVDATDPLASWFRFGMNITGDTSERQVYLPRAGTYVLAIADTRTLFQYATGGPSNAAPGPGDYYVTVKQLAMPTPTALVPSGNTASATGSLLGDAAFYTVPMGTGLNSVSLAIPTIQASASVLAFDNATFRKATFALDPQTQLPAPGGTAQMYVGGFASGDQALIVADTVYNYATSPTAYTLTVRTSDATALSTTGGTATETVGTTSYGNQTDPLTLNQFYVDVGSSGEILGASIAWNHPVVGSLYDGNFDLVAQFTQLGGFFPGTWSAYTGLLRFPAPGRYYFFVYDPSGTSGTTQLTATSRIDTIMPGTIAEGPTGTGTQTLDPTYHTNVFTYDAGTDPWQTFDSTGTNTGGQQVAWFDPTTTFGRLDNLTVTSGIGPSTAPPDDAGQPLVPIFSHAYTTGGGAIGRILLDDPTTSYLVKVDATSAAATTATFALTFDKRTITDFGTLAANGLTTTSTGHVLDSTTTAGYFLFRTANGNLATITTHPQSVALDTELQRVNDDESALGPLVDNPTGDDTATFVQAGHGWTAFIVTAAANVGSNMYDVSVRVDPPVTYAETASTATFTDICAVGGGGVAIAFAADPGRASNDDGLSTVAIAAPSGFDFFGVPVASFVVSTNGWLSFDTSQTSSAPANQDLPDATPPNNVVAPYWDDLKTVSACSKASGTTVTVQWDGTDASGSAVHAQAILDSSTNTITFAWSSAQTALGASATIGLEDAAGANAKLHSYDTANAIAAGTKAVYTPM